jgi:hypothetical protein
LFSSDREQRMRTPARFVAVLAAYSVAVLPLGATTIISTINGLAGYTGLGTFATIVQAAESSWMQTGTFSGVNIAAEIDPAGSSSVSHTSTGTAYLMTQVGPGTTPANELANAPFSVTGTQFNPTLVTLFTGLTLGPGIYYLVLSAPASQSAGWDIADIPTTPTTAPGVTLVDGNLRGPEALYPPSTNFSNAFGNLLEYSVTGNAVPEPSTLVLFFAGFAGLAICNRRRVRSRMA